MSAANPSPEDAAHDRDCRVAADDPRVVAALKEYQAALDAGKRVDRREFLMRHAHLAPALAERLEVLDWMHRLTLRIRKQPGGEAGNKPSG